MDMEELQSWPVSWVYLGRTLLGDVDVSQIYRIAPIAGSVRLRDLRVYQEREQFKRSVSDSGICKEEKVSYSW